MKRRIRSIIHQLVNTLGLINCIFIKLFCIAPLNKQDSCPYFDEIVFLNLFEVCVVDVDDETLDVGKKIFALKDKTGSWSRLLGS